LSKAERDYLVASDQINHDYYCVKSRLLKKLKVFVDQELPLLIENGYLAENCKLAENCNILNEPNRASQSFAISHFHAPWPGGEQCEQDPCRKAYEIASHRTWQTASSR
jgi:hypothetical protein